MATHREAILDQFTRQAIPFSTSPGITDEAALELVIAACGAGPDDTVLDVACGPGILACAFARVAGHVTGIDITPAMLDRARLLQQERGLANVTWQQGDVVPLPFADHSFSLVTSRFAFHHLLDPAGALREMARVCRPGGRVMLIDAAPPAEKADAFNLMEKLRDPSHARAMPLAELTGLFAGAGRPAPRTSFYRLEAEVEGLLQRSFPDPGNDAKIREMFRASLDDDRLGVGARRDGDTIRFAYPVAVLVADKL
jgi:SAM-dependent methyltransferase